MLISIFDTIHLINLENVQEFTENQLLYHYAYWTFLLYKLDIYDIDNNSLHYIKGFKVFYLIQLFLLNTFKIT